MNWLLNYVRPKLSASKIEKDIPDSLIGYGDPVKLEMVVHNYVSNALSHAKYEKIIRTVL